MPWNNGTFTRSNGVNTGATTWATDESGGVGIVSSRHDTHDQDLATGINQCINKDGSNTASQLNVDNLRLDGNTISSTNTNGDITLTPNGTGKVVISEAGSAVSGYVSGMRTYLHKDGSASSVFDVKTNVTEGTFESFGPTGSGATNIWTAMDAMPSSATIAILGLRLVINPSAADSVAFVDVFARQTGSSAAVGDPTKIASLQVASDDQATLDSNLFVIVKVPLDSSRRFDITWDGLQIDSGNVDMYLKGFVV